MNETELIFTEALNCKRSDLYLNGDKSLTKEAASFVSDALKRRMQGEPVQYIIGETEFMGLEFCVDKNVLIPRPETEILVETMIKYSPCVVRNAPRVEILDLGTGSGCLAISLVRLIANASVTATDISPQALEVARNNAQLNNVMDKIRFIQSDLFTHDALRSTRYDIIVSNPPYISSQEIATLQPEVQHEPRIALDGGDDGLDFYRKIIKMSPTYLKNGSYLIMEMGFNQSEEIKNFFAICSDFKIIEVVRDYNNIERVIVARYNG